jgi:TorA maturation chaperone TorD
MTNTEKERFCGFAAALLAPPDGALTDDLQQPALQTQLQEYVQAWGGDRRLLSVFSNELGRDDFLSAMQGEYSRLFVEPDGEKISLVESAYKPWTVDRGCGMVFAASTGLVMGDHAVHMLDIYQQMSLEVPEGFQSMPDHLVLELEFLGLLYQFASNEQVEGFIRDHLDWIPDLKGEMEKANAHLFYRNGVELVHLFLQNEMKNGKVKAHG